MKQLEYIGVLLAAIGFSCLSFGFMLTGFIMGLFSCVCLIAFLKYSKLNGLLALQCFFFCVNLIGIYNNF